MNQDGEKVQGLGLLTRAMATSTGNILRSYNFAMSSHFQELAKHAQRWLAGSDVRRQTCACFVDYMGATVGIFSSLTTPPTPEPNHHQEE